MLPSSSHTRKPSDGQIKLHRFIQSTWKRLKLAQRRRPVLLTFLIAFFALTAFIPILAYYQVGRRNAELEKISADFGKIGPEFGRGNAEELRRKKVLSSDSGLTDALTNASGTGRQAPPASTLAVGIVGGRILSRQQSEQMKWQYASEEKALKYVGNRYWLDKLPEGSRGWFNSLATFQGADTAEYPMHGNLDLTANGSSIWPSRPLPPPLDQAEGGRKLALKNGGFYLNLSDALPLDRVVPDTREEVCKQQKFDVQSLPDASIIITFYNEPISTLMRTVHSVLNYSPPPLVREIILVDDHSDIEDNRPGSVLYHHVAHLPKVKLMRLPERKGIVLARVAGAKSAKGDVLVVLDSHIEVNAGWLEPQLQRIKESPVSIVFPQILSLTHDTLEYKPTSGIGCFLTFRWVVVEQASLTGKVSSPKAMPSPSMAGGLFAIDREWFWELGGYDEGFVAWGAENVELAFRAWMCGGRVECMPCSRTYHIFRKEGAGYSNPSGALWLNRKRTARIWMDEYYQLASKMIDLSASHDVNKDIGSLDQMLRLKERLECKSFQWFLLNVDPNHDVQSLDDVIAYGRIDHHGMCIDLGGARTPGTNVTVFPCHSQKNYSGNQAFLISRYDTRIRLMANDKRCLAWSDHLQVEQCSDKKSSVWTTREIQNYPDKKTREILLVFKEGTRDELCLSLVFTPSPSFKLVKCQVNNQDTHWIVDTFQGDPNFKLPSVKANRFNLRRHLKKYSQTVVPPRSV